MPINPSRLPNRLIIGAPRCGTTSLHDWLLAHPRAAAPKRKETFYLMDRTSFEFDPDSNVHNLGLAGYERLFAGCEEATVRLESTAGYLYQETALEVLAGLVTEPRFIVLLRDPAERVLSTFRYFQGHKAQLPAEMTLRGFVAAVDAAEQPVRANEFLGQAIDHSRYARHLARWRDRVGRDRIRVVVFEELRRDPRALVPALADWCGLDPSFYETYAWPRRNESYQVRSKRLHSVVRRFVAPWIRSERLRKDLRRLYIALNGGSARSAGGEGEVLAALRQRFSIDNARLAEEWQLDLSAWGSHS